MLLAIDVGNTNIEFGFFNGIKYFAKFRLSSKREMTSDEIGLNIVQFMNFHSIDSADIEEIVIESVVPQVMYSLTNAIKKYLKKPPIIIGEDIKVDIVNLYDKPSDVGADRLVTAYSAKKKFGSPIIVVDFGTATTFDAINKDGEYEGGAIFPGIKISLNALFQNTAKLPKVEIVATEHVIGGNTVESLQSGMMYGYLGAVENIVKMMKQKLGENTTVVATGGLAKLVGSSTDCLQYIQPNLILDGIAMVYQDYKNNH